MDRNYPTLSQEEYEQLFRNPLGKLELLAGYLGGPTVLPPNPNVDEFTDSQPEEHEEFVPNTQPAQVVYNFMAPTEVVAPTVSIGNNTATVDPLPNPQLIPEEEGGTTSARTRKKTKVTSSVWNDFELSIRIQSDCRKERWGTCKICKREIQCTSSTHGTSQLRKHIEPCRTRLAEAQRLMQMTSSTTNT